MIDFDITTRIGLYFIHFEIFIAKSVISKPRLQLFTANQIRETTISLVRKARKLVYSGAGKQEHAIKTAERHCHFNGKCVTKVI